MKPKSRKLLLGAVIALIGLKCAVLGWYFLFSDQGPHFVVPFVTEAVAQEEKGKDTAAKNVQPEAQPADEFLAEIKRRRTEEIQHREEQARTQTRLATQEQARLDEAKGELDKILSQMNALGGKYDEKLSEIEAKMKEMQDLGGEQMLKLAKVFEETPPEQAGPMLTKLTPQMAAQILMRMSSRKAGKIWGQVKPEEGVKISEEMVKLKGE